MFRRWGVASSMGDLATHVAPPTPQPAHPRPVPGARYTNLSPAGRAVANAISRRPTSRAEMPHRSAGYSTGDVRGGAFPLLADGLSAVRPISRANAVARAKFLRELIATRIAFRE